MSEGKIIDPVKIAFWVICAYMKPFNSLTSYLYEKHKKFELSNKECNALYGYIREFHGYTSDNKMWYIDPINCSKFYADPISDKITERIKTDPLEFVPGILSIAADKQVVGFFNDKDKYPDFWVSIQRLKELIE